MPMAVPILMIASAAVSAYGAYQQGQAAKKAGDYNAAVNAQNADIARKDAAANATQQDRENEQRIGAMRANIGASGGTGAGSALDVLGDTASQNALQRQMILYGGEQQARGYNNTATLDKFEGQQAAKGGTLKAGAELLQGAGNAYFAGSQLKQAGSTVSKGTVSASNKM